MSEEIQLPIDKYGVFKQRSMLRNCTQFPTQSGNAETQIATIPDVRQEPGVDFLADINSEIKQVKDCFEWTIFRLRCIPDNMEYIHLKKSGGYNIMFSFPAFVASEYNNWGNFTCTEFVEKDAEKWVVLQFNNKAYKFSVDIKRFDAINTSGEIETFKPESEIYEIFIEGTFYESYKRLLKIDSMNIPWYITVLGDGHLIENLEIGESWFYQTGSSYLEYAQELKNVLEKLNENLLSREYLYTIIKESEFGWFRRYINEHNQYYDSSVFTLNNVEFHSGLAFFWVNFWRNKESINNFFPVIPTTHPDPFPDPTIGNITLTNDEIYNVTQKEIYVTLNRTLYEHLNDIAYRLRIWMGGSDYYDEKSKYQELGDSTRYKILERNEVGEDLFNTEERRPNVWSIIKDRFVMILEQFEKATNVVVRDVWNPQVGISWNIKRDWVTGVKQTNLNNKNYEWAPFNFYNLIYAIDQRGMTNEAEIATYQQIYNSVYNNYSTIESSLKTQIDELKELLEEIEETIDFEGRDDAILYVNTIKTNREELLLGFEENYKLWKNNNNIIVTNENPAYDKFWLQEEFKKRIAEHIALLDKLISLAQNVPNIDDLKQLLLKNKSDKDIIWVEQISHMLLAVASDNTFYYSLPGTSVFESLNFYNAEYANSMIHECWRLANRVVFITNNTVEFWDITNDFEDPLSPAYSSNVYSIQSLKNSIVRFNDTLYFIGRPVEMNVYSVFSINKNGQLTNISYPQLEAWVNDVLFYRNVFNDSMLVGSAVDIEHIPFIQWNLRNDVDKLTYNIVHESFCFNERLYLYSDRKYWLFNGMKIGTLDEYYNGSGVSIPCEIATANTNFGGKKRNVISLGVDIDLEEGKRDERENIVNEPPDADGRMRERTASRERFMYFSFDRVSKLPWTSNRKILLKPQQGNRNVVFKVFGIGLGVDFQARIKWNGYLRINGLKLEIE